MVERQEAQEHLVSAHFGQGGGPGETLGRDLVVRERDALGPAGASGGEHDRGRFVEGHPASRRQKPFDLGRSHGPAQGVEEQSLVRFAGRGLIEDDNHKGPGRALPDVLEQAPADRRIRHGDRDPQPVEDIDQVVEVEMGIERRIQDIVEKAGQVGAGAGQAILGEDRHPRRPSVGFGQGQERRGGLPRHPLDLLVCPRRGERSGAVLEEDLMRMGPDAGKKKIEQRILRPADQAKSGFRPSSLKPGLSKAPEKWALPGLAQELVNGLPILPFPRPPPGQGFQGRQHRLGRLAGTGPVSGGGPVGQTLQGLKHIVGHGFARTFHFKPLPGKKEIIGKKLYNERGQIS